MARNRRPGPVAAAQKRQIATDLPHDLQDKIDDYSQRRWNRDAFSFSFRQCLEHGIPGDLIYAAIPEVNPAAIDRLSRLLLTEVWERSTAVKVRRADRSKAPPRARGMMPPALVDRLLAWMVERCANRGVPPPRSLAALVHAHLNTDDFLNAAAAKGDKYRRAVHYVAVHPRAKQVELAAYAGVTESTAWNWRRQPAFKREVETIRQNPSHLDLVRHTLEVSRPRRSRR